MITDEKRNTNKKRTETAGVNFNDADKIFDDLYLNIKYAIKINITGVRIISSESKSNTCDADLNSEKSSPAKLIVKFRQSISRLAR